MVLMVNLSIMARLFVEMIIFYLFWDLLLEQFPSLKVFIILFKSLHRTAITMLR